MILEITNKSNFRFYPINSPGQADTSQAAVQGKPSAAFYVAFVALAVAASGVLLNRYAPGATVRKRCPACAERVQHDARVCKHCGYRFV